MDTAVYEGVERVAELETTEELGLELTGTETLEDALEELEAGALELLEDGSGPLAW